MGWNDPDVYYQPEKFGLQIIGELNDPNADYSFYDLVIWQHEDGRLFYASDSGCSCPSPFEAYNSLDDLTEITNENWDDFKLSVERHAWDVEYNGPKDPQAADKTDLLKAVAYILDGRTIQT